MPPRFPLRPSLTGQKGPLVGTALLLIVCFGLTWYLVTNITYYGESIQRQSMTTIESDAPASHDTDALTKLRGVSENKNSTANMTE